MTQLTFFGHVEEFRRRVLVSLASLLGGAVIGYFFSDKALEFLILPILSEVDRLYFFAPQEAFVTRIKVTVFLGLLLSSPVMISQIWIFVSPALYPRERKSLLPLILVTTFLFFLGVLFSFFIVLPFAIRFLVGMDVPYLSPMISVTEYITFLTSMSLAFGVAFNTPVLILTLVLLGVTRAKDLNHFRRHAIVLTFIAAAVLTPGPDVASQLLLAIPLLLLFELSVLAAMVLERRRKSGL